MIRHSIEMLLAVAGFSVVAAGCAPNGAAAGSDPRPRVFVCIPPQAFLVERIAGDRVQLSVLVGPGQSPHTFEATPRQLAALSEARLFLALDFPFEQQLLAKAAATARSMKIVNTAQGAPRRVLTDQEAADAIHDHDLDDHDHAPGAADPHIWLAPRLLIHQAEIVRDALSELDPAHAAEFDRNCEQLKSELIELDRRLRHELAAFRGREFFVFHPAWGYFADAYGLRQVAIENNGKEPGIRELARLIDRARAAHARLILVEPQYSRRTADALAREVSAQVETIDPNARDVPGTLLRLAELIVAAGQGKLP